MYSMGCFFKLCHLTCLNNSLFFFSEPLLIFGGKRCRLLSPFRRETRLGVDRYFRTICWPLFGIPPLWFRVGSPKTLSCLDRVRATITFQCPRILSTQEIQLLPTGSITLLWSLESRFPEEAVIWSCYQLHLCCPRNLKFPDQDTTKLFMQQWLSVMMGGCWG